MANTMNDSRGCSVCAPGNENYETFTVRVSRLRPTRVQYDYRTPDGERFACVGRNLEDCRHKRDEWLAARN